MNDDPRWQEVRAFLDWREGNDDAPAGEFLDQFQRYTAVLEAIAADVAVASDQRAAAQDILDDIAGEARNQCSRGAKGDRRGG